MADSFLNLPGDFQPGKKYTLRGETLRAWQDALQRDRALPGRGMLESQTPQGRLLHADQSAPICGWSPYIPNNDFPLRAALQPAFVFLGGSGREIKAVMPSLDITPTDVTDLGIKLDVEPFPTIDLDDATEYQIFLIYRYYDDEDPETDETYARIVILDDTEEIVDIATPDEKWIKLSDLETENGRIKEVEIEICGPTTLGGGGGGGSPTCTNLKPRLQFFDDGTIQEWRLFVSPGSINPEVPKINDRKLTDLDVNGLPPYFVVTSSASLWALIDWVPKQVTIEITGGYYSSDQVIISGDPENMRYVVQTTIPDIEYPAVDPDVNGLQAVIIADIIEHDDGVGNITFSLEEFVCGSSQVSLCPESQQYIYRVTS